MSDLVRFGVSIENGLLDEFDTLIRERGYSNRSEAIRDLIRGYTAEREWEEGGEAAGGIVYVYDHHQRELSEHKSDLVPIGVLHLLHGGKDHPAVGTLEVGELDQGDRGVARSLGGEAF